jgi:hypothetical protein
MLAILSDAGNLCAIVALGSRISTRLGLTLQRITLATLHLQLQHTESCFVHSVQIVTTWIEFAWPGSKVIGEKDDSLGAD